MKLDSASKKSSGDPKVDTYCSLPLSPVSFLTYSFSVLLIRRSEIPGGQRDQRESKQIGQLAEVDDYT